MRQMAQDQGLARLAHGGLGGAIGTGFSQHRGYDPRTDAVYVEPKKPKTLRDELQAETDEWVKDILI